MKALNFLLIATLYLFRPLLGPAYCKYPIRCTEYAIEQLKNKKLFVALWLILKRICSCF